MTASLRQISGVALLLLGALGLLLPVMPGIPLLIGGVALLGHDHALVRPWLRHLKERGLWRRSK